MMASVAAVNNLGGHAHNPRGNLWFNDDSTFGHRLLMKMGWNKGKGLGKNEDGIKENVKVKFRNTNSGLGFKDDAHANVMKTEYESILKNLAAQYSCPTATDAKANDNHIEEPITKSKVVKSKLRYPKLFFGKDVTKYSEKDMKSIFICSAPLKSIEGESENLIISDKTNSESEPPQTYDTYSSSLSISDYFAKKMEEKKNNALNKTSYDNTATHEQTCLQSKNSDTSDPTYNGNIKFKRKQKDTQVDIVKECNNIAQNENSSETERVEVLNFASSDKKSSRKRKKKSDISIEDNEVKSNEEVLENSLSKTIFSSIKAHTIENITNQSSSRPSKKRKVLQEFEYDPADSSDNRISGELKPSSSPTKKKKKKSKISSETNNLSLENPVHENNTPTENHIETNNDFPLESTETELSINKDCSKKKKKSKKKLKEKLKSCLKSKCGSYSLRNISFNETVSYRIIDSEFESVEPLTSCENLDENVCHMLTDGDTYNNSSDDAYSEEKTDSSDIDSGDSICANEQDNVIKEPEEECILYDLPSSKSSYYNEWVESQKQALKMQLYKNMLKGIKNHEILKTTNLLSIKGYGNWGYQ